MPNDPFRWHGKRSVLFDMYGFFTDLGDGWMYQHESGLTIPITEGIFFRGKF